jgi:hypothetical protein
MNLSPFSPLTSKQEAMGELKLSLGWGAFDFNFRWSKQAESKCHPMMKVSQKLTF